MVIEACPFLTGGAVTSSICSQGIRMTNASQLGLLTAVPTLPSVFMKLMEAEEKRKTLHKDWGK